MSKIYHLNLAWCDGCCKTHILIDSPDATVRMDLSPEQTGELAQKLASAAYAAAGYLPMETPPQCILTIGAGMTDKPS